VPWSKTDWKKFQDFDTATATLWYSPLMAGASSPSVPISDFRADNLCLSFDGYQGVDLQKSTHRCK
jgi:hypothetical protein